jgi:hypothetical protein
LDPAANPRLVDVKKVEAAVNPATAKPVRLIKSRLSIPSAPFLLSRTTSFS